MPRTAPHRITHRLLALLTLLLVVSGCKTVENPITGRQVAGAYSWEQEVQIGQESDPQIVAQFGIYDDPELTRYVDLLGQGVLEVSHMRRPDTDPKFKNTPFTFRVLDSPVVNAFALPGGYIYVTRGLLTHLNNEAQLVVVLGHEIGHVAARHASRQAAAAQRNQFLAIGGALVAETLYSGAGQALLNYGGAAVQLLQLRYGRDDERQSDRLGVEYATLTGYAAEEGSAFFVSLKRISDRAGQAIPSFLSTHPDPGEREQTIRQLADEWEAKVAGESDKLDTEEFMSKIEGIVIGEDPRQGFTEDGYFNHPELRFRFPVPQGFGVINQPTQVAMIEENQQAYLIFSLSQDDPQTANSNFARQEGLTVRDGGTLRSQVGTGYYTVADAQMDGQDVRAIAYFVSYGGNTYHFLGLSATSTFSTYQNSFLRAMEGFGQLTDNRLLNRQPTRLQVVRADRSGSFRSFLPNNLPAEWDAEQLAIMNQVTLDEQIQAGRYLKLPR